VRRALFVFCALSAPLFAADGNRGMWRLSVGPSFIGSIEAKMRVDNSAIVRASGFPLTLGGMRINARSRAEAIAAGDGTASGDGTRVFDDGAFYNPVDSASGNDGAYSWNWKLHDPSYYREPSYRGFVEHTAFCDVVDSSHALVGGDSEEWMPGIRVEAFRELYRSDDERPWGIDVALAFSYYFQRDVWKASGTAANSGVYEWRNDSNGEAQYILAGYGASQFHDGYWGAGTFDGPGAEIANAWTGPTLLENSSGRLTWSGKGSYREYSVEALVRPWWEPWDWLRLFVSLGIEVSRREFDWKLSASGTDGASYGEHTTEEDWRVLGLLGGGLSLQWNGFFVAGEALWRGGGDDLDVDGATVHGAVEHGDFALRAMFGYEF